MDQEIYNSEKYLRALPLQGGFTVPTHYFSELEMRLIQEEEIAFTPNPKDGFVVPDAYFSELHSLLVSKVGQTEAKQISIHFKPAIKWFGLAASVFLVFGIFLYESRLTQTHGSNPKISADEIAEQLNEGDLSEELLCEAGWCSELEKLNMMSDTSSLDVLNSDLEDAIIMDEL